MWNILREYLMHIIYIEHLIQLRFLHQSILLRFQNILSYISSVLFCHWICFTFHAYIWKVDRDRHYTLFIIFILSLKLCMCLRGWRLLYGMYVCICALIQSFIEQQQQLHQRQKNLSYSLNTQNKLELPMCEEKYFSFVFFFFFFCHQWRIQIAIYF